MKVVLIHIIVTLLVKELTTSQKNKSHFSPCELLACIQAFILYLVATWMFLQS